MGSAVASSSGAVASSDVVWQPRRGGGIDCMALRQWLQERILSVFDVPDGFGCFQIFKVVFVYF